MGKQWKLRKREKREIRRLKRAFEKAGPLIKRGKKERGKESEEFVLRLSEVLKKEGEKIDFCPTGFIKKLDKIGIDIIYWLKQGIYLVNVKSSETGAIDFYSRRQFSKRDLLIYTLVRYPGDSAELVKSRLFRIFQEPPSLTVLPEWIKKELRLGDVQVKTKLLPSKEKKQNQGFLGAGQVQVAVDSSVKLPALKRAEAQKIFEGIIGVERIGVVTSPKSSLAKRHVEIICWTSRGIYPFDIHEEDIVLEGGLKIFPLNPSWPKSKIEEILREKPQETFPPVICGAIWDLE